MATVKNVVKKTTRYAPNYVGVSFLSNPATDVYGDHIIDASQFDTKAEAVTHIDAVVANHADSVFEVKEIYV